MADGLAYAAVQALFHETPGVGRWDVFGSRGGVADSFHRPSMVIMAPKNSRIWVEVQSSSGRNEVKLNTKDLIWIGQNVSDGRKSSSRIGRVRSGVLLSRQVCGGLAAGLLVAAARCQNEGVEG